MKYVVLCSRIIWRLFALTIILLAVVVTLGRELIGELPDYREKIETLISNQLGMRVESRQVSGDWSGFSPSLTLANLAIFPKQMNEPVVSVTALKAQPDFLGSLLRWNLEWRELSAGHVALTLLEREDGSWTLAGLPQTEGETDLDGLLQMLQGSTYLKIDEATLQVAFYSGETSVVRLRNMLIENSGSFHRVAASVAFADGAEAAKLIIEGKGALFDVDQFNGTAYLRLQRLNFQGPVSALLKRWIPAIAEQQDFDAKVEAELWLKKTRADNVYLTGYLKAAEIPLLVAGDVPPLTQVATEITGGYRPGRDWYVSLQEIDFVWGERRIEPLTISYRQQLGDPLGFGTLAIDHFNLAIMSDLLQSNRLLPEKGLQALAELQPKGRVKAVQLQIKPNEKKRGKPTIVVRANLHDVAVASWKNAPASRGINGFIELRGTEGVLQLDSPDGFAMLYPTVYDDYMVHPSARGEIRWRLDKAKDAVIVNSGPIQIEGEKGAGAAYLYLDIPLHREQGPGVMFLQVGLRDTHSQYRNDFIPRTLNPRLLAWLDTAIGETPLQEAGFIWRGSLARDEHDKRSIQLYLRTRDGRLKFHPDWPELRQLDAVLTLDDDAVKTAVQTAALGSVAIRDSEVLVSSGQVGSELTIKGQAMGDAGDAVAVLAASPLQDRIGALSEWRLTGEAAIEVDLKIPLVTTENSEPSYRVDAQIDAATLIDPRGEFVFEGLSGALRYRDQTGLTGHDLQAKLWGDNPLSGTLKPADQGTVLDLQGELNLEQLLQRLQLPLEGLLRGHTAYRAGLTFAPGQPAQLAIDSTLEGVALELPEPFGKPANTASDFNLTITFEDEAAVFRGDHNRQLYFAFALQQDGISDGVLSINEPNVLERDNRGLRINGILHQVALQDWLPVYQKIKGLGGGIGKPLQTRVTLKMDTLQFDRFSLRDVALTGAPDGNGDWRIAFVSDVAQGECILPSEEALPISLNLQTLDLELPAAADAGDSVLAGIEPSRLPHLDLQIDKLSVNSKPYGSLSFLMQPLSNGVELRNIKGNMFGLELGVGDDDEAVELDQQTRLLWIEDQGVSLSRFSGVVGTGDIADFLAHFEASKIIDSKQATFVTDISWRGTPGELNLETLAGSLVLEMEDGEFYRSPKGAGNAVIRVVGLFNFANWVRRLKLDFSDLFAKGMTYDNVRGGVTFDQGVMTFESPIVVKMPSGRMKWSGSADLLSEQLDAYLVMTVPVSTNLPWVAALAGGLPAAAGVYITSKLFEKQLDRLSSLSYKVTGSWDDPNVAVDRIFSDKGAVMERAKKTKDSGSK